MTVLLVRHGRHAEVGRVLSGRSDIGLSDAGRHEAALLARRLAGTSLAAVHSSPRRRARETAEPVAAAHGLAVEIVEALDEIDFGAWSGRHFAALDEDAGWRRWNAARATACPPGGEPMAVAAGRAVRHVEALGPDGATVLCVSHCDIIRAVAARYLGLGLDGLLAFDVDPGSLTTLDIHTGGGRVVALNERLIEAGGSGR